MNEIYIVLRDFLSRRNFSLHIMLSLNQALALCMQSYFVNVMLIHI